MKITKTLLSFALLAISLLCVPAFSHALQGQSGAGPKVGGGSLLDRSNSDPYYYRTDRSVDREARKQHYYNQSTLQNKSIHSNDSRLGNDTYESVQTQERVR